MAHLQPIYQSPRDLQLFIWRGAAPERLSVLRERTVRIGAWQFTFRIIGESHWISAQYADSPALHEVLVCAEILSPKDAHQHAFRHLCDHAFSTADARYALTITFTTQQGALKMPKRGLGLTFPPILGQTAFTHIAWRVDRSAEQVVWQTQHVYPQPDSLIAVKSVSRLMLAQPPTL